MPVTDSLSQPGPISTTSIDIGAQSFLIKIYAKFLYSGSMFILKCLYQNRKSSSFSKEKHDKMIGLARIAEKLFNLFIIGINKEQRSSCTIVANYESCKLFIRPFILSEILMVSGLWEPYVKRVVDIEANEDDIVVDVGANIGVYAIPLAKKVAKVIAFEPHPKTSGILESNVILNNINNVEVIKKAVGHSNKKVLYRLSVIPPYSGIASTNLKKNDSIVELEGITLDTALMNENKIDWLFIDVEGFELDVLEGARNILLRYSPKIIIESYPQNIDKVSKMLLSAGYTLSRLYSFYYYARKRPD
jgi:FkbM family methyltransferase